jgi:hypothetical protein
MHDRLKAVATSPTAYPNLLPTGEVVSFSLGEKARMIAAQLVGD